MHGIALETPEHQAVLIQFKNNRYLPLRQKHLMPSKKLPQLLTGVKLLAALGAWHNSPFLLLQAGKLTPDDHADLAKFKLDPALSGQKAETCWHPSSRLVHRMEHGLVPVQGKYKGKAGWLSCPGLLRRQTQCWSEASAPGGLNWKLGSAV